MTTETKATEDRSEVRISKILVPVDGSEYSLSNMLTLKIK